MKITALIAITALGGVFVALMAAFLMLQRHDLTWEVAE